MPRFIFAFVGALLATALLVGLGRSIPTTLAANTSASSPVTGTPAPEFTQREQATWLNSPPLTLAGLRGKVVLLDVWTTDCWNCYRSFPWVKSLEQQFASKGLVIIGIHTPEFEREKDRAGILARLKKYDLAYPQLLDDDFSYWNALGNRYWPAFYLIDKQGRIQQILVGEQHSGNLSATRFAAHIAELLAN